MWKLWLTVLVTAMCVASSHQSGGMNDVSKALYEARDKLRLTNPQEVIRNISHIVTAALPVQMTFSAPVVIKNMVVNLAHNFTNPGNIRVFLRLLKDSKMKKKGEMVRIFMKFMNPENLHPEGLIHTFQSLDDDTISELSAVFLEYIKEMAPQLLGSQFPKFEHYISYLNPDDLKELTRIAFEIFKETAATDWLWLIKRFDDEKNDFFNKTRKLMLENGSTIFEEWKASGQRHMEVKVRLLIKDIKKVMNFEKLSPHVVELVKALKTAVSHILELLFDDFKSEKINLGPLAMNVSDLISDIHKAIKSVTDLVDLEDVGADVEAALIYLKKMTHESAKSSIMDMKKIMPSAEEILEFISNSDIALLQKINKPTLLPILKVLRNMTIPDGIIDAGIDTVLPFIKTLNEKVVRNVIEFFVKESQVENEFYRVFKDIFFLFIKDHLNKIPRWNLNATNFDEMKEHALKYVQNIDETLIDELIHDVFSNLKHLDATTVLEMIGEAYTIARAALQDDVLIKGLRDPKTLVEAVNKTIFTDFVLLNLNSIKLLNETQIVHWCKNFSSLASDEISSRIDEKGSSILSLFERVENGNKVAKQIHLNDSIEFVTRIVKTMDLNQACDDVNSVLRLNKLIGAEAKNEVVNLLWSLFSKLKKVLKGGAVDVKTLQNVQEVLNAVLRAFIRANGSKPTHDPRAEIVRIAIRSVDKYAQTGKFRLLFEKTPEEEESEKATYDMLARELEESQFDDDDMKDTIIPFNATLMKGMERPVDVMMLTPEQRKANELQRAAAMAKTTTEATDDDDDIYMDMDESTTKNSVHVTENTVTWSAGLMDRKAHSTTPIYTPDLKIVTEIHTKALTPELASSSATTATKVRTTATPLTTIPASVTLSSVTLKPTTTTSRPTTESAATVQMSSSTQSMDVLDEEKPLGSEQNRNPDCAQDIHDVINRATLPDGAAWAKRMFDGWISVGPYRNSSSVSSTHACLSMKHPRKVFSGKFCSANATVTLIWPDSTVPQIKTVETGICMPSSCEPTEFTNLLREIVKDMNVARLVVSADTCITNSSHSESKHRTAAQIVLAIIVGIVLVCTLYAFVIKLATNKRPWKWLDALSLEKTGKQCFSAPESEGHLSAIYGVRAVGLAMFIATCITDCIISAGFITRKQALSSWNFVIPLNLYAASDVLLFAGGALAAVSFRKAVASRGAFGVFANVVKTYFRWVFSVGAMILLRIALLNHTNGDDSTCSKSWWQPLLFIQNFISVNNACLPHGWFLSLEMQLFMWTPLVLYLPIKPLKLKWLVSIIVSALLTAVPIGSFMSYTTDVLPFPMSSDTQFEKDLVKPHMRAASWIVGIVVGDILHYQVTADTKFHLPIMKSLTVLVLSTSLWLACVFSSKYFTATTRPLWQTAVFVGLSHFGIGLALAGIVLIATKGHTGWIKGILSSGILNVLGRLSLCAFLMHMPLITFLSEVTTAIDMDPYTLLIWFIGNYAVTYIAAAILSLVVELPIKNISKLIYDSQTLRGSQQNLIIANVVTDNNNCS